MSTVEELEEEVQTKKSVLAFVGQMLGILRSDREESVEVAEKSTIADIEAEIDNLP